MKKVFLKTTILLSALIVGSLNVWGDTYYEKVTSTEDLVADGEYILLETSSATDYLVNTTYSSSKYGTVTSGFTISGSTVTVATATKALVVKLGGSAGTWTLWDVNYKGWLGKGDSNTNFARSQSASAPTTNNGYYWDIKTKGSELAIYSKYKSSSKDHTGRYIGRNGDAIGPYEGASYPACVLYKKIVFTITAASNNISWGTVSESDGVITATPAEGYRVSTSTPYTITPAASATISQSGNKFTVSPSANTTVTINFEATPSHTLSFVIEADDDNENAGVVTLGATSVQEGSTTTISAAANAGYKFTGWTVTGTGASIYDAESASTSVTMGTANATVTANFVAVTTYPVHWNVNGTVVKTDNVEENTAIAFAAPTSGVPGGYAFTGWVAAANRIDGTTNTDPKANYVTSANATGEITYYAVLANTSITGDANTYALVTNASQLSEGNKIIFVSEDYNRANGAKSGTMVGTVSVTIKDHQIVSTTVTPITLEKKSSNWIFKLGTEYMDHIGGKKINFNATDATATTHTISITDNKAEIKIVGVSDTVFCYNDNSGSNQRFNYYKAKQNDIWIYKQTLAIVYSNYCTTIPERKLIPTPDGYTTYYDATNKIQLPTTDISGDDISISAYRAEYDDSEGLLVLKALTGANADVIPAGWPVILKASPASAFTVSTSDATAFDNAGLTNDLSGSTGVAANANTYVLAYQGTPAAAGFYKMTSGVIPEHKAYLDLSGYGAAPAIRLVVEEENNTTAVENIESTDKTVKFFENGILYINRNGITYDVTGRIVK